MRHILILSLALTAGLASSNGAADDQPILLFDGQSLNGWTNSSGDKPAAGWVVEDGALVCKGKAGDLWTKERFGNFVLELEFKTTGNSGVFIRTDSPKNNVQTGIEIQIHKPGGPGKHSVGAVYDALAPTKNAATDGWNQLVITAKDNELQVKLNGELIIEMDLNRWSTAGQNPDGSKNKFKTALKDFKREGHIGFQDHGAEVAYRNVRIRRQ